MAMTATPARRPATERDLDTLPDHLAGHIVDGELVTLPRPDPPHTGTASDLAIRLGPPLRFGRGGPGGWVLLIEPKVWFGDDLLVPDLAAWRRERFVAPRKGAYGISESASRDRTASRRHRPHTRRGTRSSVRSAASGRAEGNSYTAEP
jgi:hypothetical protein